MTTIINEKPIKIKEKFSVNKKSSRAILERSTRGAKGYLTSVHRKFFADPNGEDFNVVTGVRGYYKNIIVCKNKENLQTLAGRDDEIDKDYIHNGQGTAASNWIAVSADGTAPSTADTVLAGEITNHGMGRAQATTRTHTTGLNDWSLSLTFTNTTAQTAGIVKYGLFTAVSSGVLNHENTAASVTLEVGDQLIVTWSGTLG